MADKGRPNAYKEKIEPRKEEIIKWARAGATNKEICSALGVSYSAFCNHVSKNTDFSDSLREARMSGVPEIKMALYKKAIGFEYTEKKTYIKKDENGDSVQYVEETRKYSPPDTTAIQIYLRNNADDFRDKDKITYDFKEMEIELKKQMMEMTNF